METLKQQHRLEIAQALIAALAGADYASAAANAAWALGELGAVEALPALRLRASTSYLPFTLVSQACEEAIARLESHAALPRPAEASSHDVEMLPRIPEVVADRADTLPRPAKEAQ